MSAQIESCHYLDLDIEYRDLRSVQIGNCHHLDSDIEYRPQLVEVVNSFANWCSPG